MAIPRIIHQTFKSAELPPAYIEFRDALLSMHPGWEYRFYDDAACREAVERILPALLPMYDAAYTIQKTDIFRVVAVYGEGGFYLDMDTICLSPFDDLTGFSSVFAQELTLTPEVTASLGHKYSRRLANFMFGSEPRHRFLLRILARMVEECRRDIKTEEDVLQSTGPGLVTNVYFDNEDELRDVALVLNVDRECPRCKAVGCHFGNYAAHYHASSWRWNEAWGDPARKPAGQTRISGKEQRRIQNGLAKEIENLDTPDSVYMLRTYVQDPYDGLSTVYRRIKHVGREIDDSRFVKGGKVLVCGVPTMFAHLLSGANRNAVYTTFETYSLPRHWVEAINSCCSLCIVPHDHIKRVFEDSGVGVPVEVVQQGYTRHVRTFKRNPGEGIFRIGFLGVPYVRKNLFKLFQACVNLKGEIPGLRLAVHSVLLYPDLCGTENVIIEHSPFVEWTSGTMDLRAMSAWFDSLSCYVFPSSGEGWSFTPRESLYMGVPTVLSDIPVHRELVESGFCRVIPVSGKEDSDYAGLMFGQWDRVTVTDIEEAIRAVYRSYGLYLMKAIQGAQWIENRWTNEDSIQKALALMRSL